MVRLKVSLVVLLLAAVDLGQPAVAVEAGRKPLGVGSPAPRFLLPDLAGRPLEYQGQGRITVLVFWAFWCDTWKEAMPYLRELADLRRTLPLHLLCISVDGTLVAEYHRQGGKPLPWPVLLDSRGEVTRRYGVRFVPTIFVINSRREIVYTAEGYPGNQVLRRQIFKAVGRVDRAFASGRAPVRSGAR